MNIDVCGLGFSYGLHTVLQDISFSVKEGELLSVLGPNGVGKSTLFKCMLGLLAGYTGSVRAGDKDTAKIPPRELARLFAYIPQAHHPIFNYAVLDVVIMGMAHQLETIVSPGKKQITAAHAALEQVGIGSLAAKNYLNLSGGEQQLVLIARALAQQAGVLLMDEPTSNLDFGNQLLVLQEIRRLTHSGYTVIMSSHNPQHAMFFSDTILALKDGRIAAWGAPDQVMDEALLRLLYGVDVRITQTEHGRIIVPVLK